MDTTRTDSNKQEIPPSDTRNSGVSTRIKMIIAAMGVVLVCCLCLLSYMVFGRADHNHEIEYGNDIEQRRDGEVNHYFLGDRKVMGMRAATLDEEVEMLKRYGIIDEHAPWVTINDQYQENPISIVSKDLLYHFMMYKDGVEEIRDYPYIDKLIELYCRANTEPGELLAPELYKLSKDAEKLNNATGAILVAALTNTEVNLEHEPKKTFKRLPMRCLEAFFAAGATIADIEACRKFIFLVEPRDAKLVDFLYMKYAESSSHLLSKPGKNRELYR